MIVWAIGIIITDWEAMSKEAGESWRASFVVWVCKLVANWAADAVNAVHTIRTSSWVSLGVAIDFREADATDTLVSRRAISSICTDRIAMSKEAPGAFWALAVIIIICSWGAIIRLANSAACTINTFKELGTVIIDVTTQNREA
jgi:hypothetical protein